MINTHFCLLTVSLLYLLAHLPRTMELLRLLRQELCLSLCCFLFTAQLHFHLIRFQCGFRDEPIDNIKLTLGAIRPRAHEKVPVDKLIPGQKYLANYNIEVPGGRGYWYDCIITQVNNIFVSIRKLILNKICHT